MDDQKPRWTKYQEQYIKIWVGHKTPREMGEHINKSRDAVIGKLNRMGIVIPCPPSKPKEKRKRLRVARAGVKVLTLREHTEVKGFKTNECFRAPTEFSKPLLNVMDSECRFPVTEEKPVLFCAVRTIDGGVYCIEHTERAYDRPKKPPIASL